MDDLDRLFRLYQSELQAMARRRLNDRELAADLVQDTFVRYASLPGERRQQLAGGSRFFLWRILGNLMVDFHRRQRHRGEHLALDSLADELLEPRPSPLRQLELQRELRSLRQALAELPGNARRALLLNRLEGLGHKEIAERLRVSPSMVSKYIMQALKHCAMRLELEREG